MTIKPRRALDDVESVDEHVTASSRVTPRNGVTPSNRVRASLAGLAVLTVMGMVATFIVSPTVDLDDRTDPTAAIPLVADVPARAERAEGASRSVIRTPLRSMGDVSLEPLPAASPEEVPTAPANPEPSPEPTPSPTPTPSETPKPAPEKPKVPEFGTIVGEKYATSPVNVRSGPGTEFDVVTSIGVGTAVSVTDVVVGDRWQQVKVGKRTGFISNKYLGNEKPKAPEPARQSEKASSAPKETQAPSKPPSAASCPKAQGIESGLTERTRNVLRVMCNQFPNISSYGGRRSGGGSYHSSGRAIDAMISGEAGWEVARWARSNAGQLGITEVIYAQHIWTAQRSGDGWRKMSDRGSVSANHYDHVHISVR